MTSRDTRPLRAPSLLKHCLSGLDQHGKPEVDIGGARGRVRPTLQSLRVVMSDRGPFSVGFMASHRHLKPWAASLLGEMVRYARSPLL